MFQNVRYQQHSNKDDMAVSSAVPPLWVFFPFWAGRAREKPNVKPSGYLFFPPPFLSRSCPAFYVSDRNGATRVKKDPGCVVFSFFPPLFSIPLFFPPWDERMISLGLHIHLVPFPFFSFPPPLIAPPWFLFRCQMG